MPKVLALPSNGMKVEAVIVQKNLICFVWSLVLLSQGSFAGSEERGNHDCFISVLKVYIL